MNKYIKALLLMIVTSLIIVGCSKEDNDRCKITNLSGVDWYDASVLLLDSEESIEGIEDIGNVSVGDVFTLPSGYTYFVVSGRKYNGKVLRSYDLRLYDGAKVTEDDMML